MNRSIKIFVERTRETCFIFYFLLVLMSSFPFSYQNCIPQYYLGHWKRVGEFVLTIHPLSRHTKRKQFDKIYQGVPKRTVCFRVSLQRVCVGTWQRRTFLCLWWDPPTTGSLLMMSSTVDAQPWSSFWDPHLDLKNRFGELYIFSSFGFLCILVWKIISLSLQCNRM